MASSTSGFVGIGLSCSTTKLSRRPISRFSQTFRRFCCIDMTVSVDEKKNFTLKKSEEAFKAAKVHSLFFVCSVLFCWLLLIYKIMLLIWNWISVTNLLVHVEIFVCLRLVVALTYVTAWSFNSKLPCLFFKFLPLESRSLSFNLAVSIFCKS